MRTHIELGDGFNLPLFNNPWDRATYLMGHSSALTLQIKMSPLAGKRKLKINLCS